MSVNITFLVLTKVLSASSIVVKLISRLTVSALSSRKLTNEFNQFTGSWDSPNLFLRDEVVYNYEVMYTKVDIMSLDEIPLILTR